MEERIEQALEQLYTFGQQDGLQGNTHSTHTKIALQAILTAVAELIGEDVRVNPYLAPQNPQEAQNRLRKHLRAQLGKEEK